MRITHWSIATGVIASWLTRHSAGPVHEWLGYATLALVVLRLAWGFAGSGHARLAGFIRSPSVTRDYALDVVRGRARRYLGHNPLGGWMALVLWSLILAVCITGWMYTTDRWWGIEWVEELHEGLTNVVLALVLVHLAGVVMTSRHQHENLVAAMLHGRKRPPGDQDVA